jgi:primosomal protein N' (replication factor Y) (superfamily II helicase)
MVVEVLPHLRTAAFDRALTYIVPAGMRVRVGDVVRTPLGRRDVYGYALSTPHAQTGDPAKLRMLAQRVDGPRAFDEVGLALARFMAERYCCSLGEALAAVVVAGAVPRVVERLVPLAQPEAGRFASVPPRLLHLVWGDLREGFSLEALLRHPEARRAGDRRSLLQAVTALVRGGALERTRTFESPRLRETRERVLEATGRDIRGPRVAALVKLVRESGQLRRADALLAGFSAATIARAVRLGALGEAERRPLSGARVLGNPPELVATREQRAVIDRLGSAVANRRFAEFVLAGVTGSGKTFVYISAIARVLADGGRAIVLVPEISLTPQTARRFEAAFGDRVAVLHSALSERERFDSWHAAARGEKAVVVGARSAVFAPLADVRLIVIDEAHERTYKQDSTPRYHATDVARERMRRAGGVLVLGSATPPLEALAATQRGEAERLLLSERATAMPLPAVHVVDMAAEFERGNRRIFSSALTVGIEQRLARNEKVVLFVNRRGSAGFVLCRACGFVPECDRCSLSLTVHRAEGLLRCHLCDAQRPVTPACPRCGGPMREFGVGTQKVAEAVQALFPHARIVRMDGDTTTHVGDHARLLDEFAEQGDVLIGTQMVAKGLDFPTVTLVGVVAADIGLHLPDFRAAERTFDLLTQVAGRSGRARAGEAIVQTYSPQHPAIEFAARHDYDGFARVELAERDMLRYPPFAELVFLGIIGRRPSEVIAAARRYADLLRGLPGVEVLGPAPYPVPRVNNEWRYRIALKAPTLGPVRAFLRETLQPAARSERSTRLVVNVDP